MNRLIFVRKNSEWASRNFLEIVNFPDRLDRGAQLRISVTSPSAMLRSSSHSSVSVRLSGWCESNPCPESSFESGIISSGEAASSKISSRLPRLSFTELQECPRPSKRPHGRGKSLGPRPSDPRAPPRKLPHQPVSRGKKKLRH